MYGSDTALCVVKVTVEVDTVEGYGCATDYDIYFGVVCNSVCAFIVELIVGELVIVLPCGDGFMVDPELDVLVDVG